MRDRNSFDESDIGTISVIGRGESGQPYHYDSARPMMHRFIPADCTRMLDVGCYAGGFGRGLKAIREIEIWGVEPLEEPARLAAKYLDKVVHDRFTTASDLPDGHFDAVVFNDSLEHFPEPDSPLRLAARKLRAGGTLVCSIPNVRFIDNLEHVLVERDWKYEERGIRDKTHLRFFTKRSMKRTLEANGFDVVEQAGINEDWWRRDKIVRRIMFRLFRELTDDMRYIQYVNVARVREVY